MPVLTIQYAPFPYQREFHASQARFRITIGGRRSGKSHSALQELFKHAITAKNANAWWVSPTLVDARDIGWEAAQSIIEDVRPLVRRCNQVRMQVRFTNGSMITFKGAESERSLRGRKVSFAVVDEAAFIAQSAWRKCIRPALSDLQGKAVLCSSPAGFNWLQAEWEAAATRPNWQRFHWPTWVNPTIAAEEIEDAKASMSASEWQQEFAAEFVTRGGQVYPDFGDANLVDVFTPNPDEHNIYLGVDPGYAGHAAIGFFAIPKAQDNRVNNADTCVYQFAELYLQRRDVHQLMSDVHRMLVKHKLQPKHVKKVYTDPAANTRESTSGISPANIIRGAGYQVENRASEIASGLALVRSFILSAAGTRRLFLSRQCPETIRSLRGYSYATGRGDVVREEPVKDGMHDHACLVGETSVLMSDGATKPLSEVRVGDLVQTSDGPRRVLGAGITGARPLWRVRFTNGRELVGTEDHPVFTPDGKVAVGNLQAGREVVSWSESNSACHPTRCPTSNSMGTPTIGTGGTTATGEGSSACMSTCGKQPTGPCHVAARSITSTSTAPTTDSKTSSASPSASTWRCTCACATPRALDSRLLPSAWPPNGTVPMSDAHGTETTAANSATASHGVPSPASSAARSTRRARLTESASAPTTASQPAAASQASTTRHAPASCAAGPSCATATPASKPARVCVEDVSSVGVVGLVYNLTVEGAHNYFANGILVSNCDQVRYFLINKFEPNSDVQRFLRLAQM